MKVRAAEKTEIDHLAKLWFDGWQDAHSKILPAELTRLRTLGSLRDRLQAALPTVRVIGPSGAPLGFCMVKGDELYQLYVSAQARGSGIAAGLMADAEAQFCAAGVKKPGWHAPSEMSVPRGSTKSVDGIGLEPWSTTWKPPRARFCWKCGAMKNP